MVVTHRRAFPGRLILFWLAQESGQQAGKGQVPGCEDTHGGRVLETPQRVGPTHQFSQEKHLKERAVGDDFYVLTVSGKFLGPLEFRALVVAGQKGAKVLVADDKILRVLRDARAADSTAAAATWKASSRVMVARVPINTTVRP